MQISTKKIRIFEKPFRNPSNRTQVKEKVFGHLSKKIWFRVCSLLSHRENVRTSKFWRKSKEKKRIFFRNFTKGI
jgi:hypothetical protein